MADNCRFEEISSAEMDKLLDNSSSKSTLKATKYGMRLFDEWRASPVGSKYSKPIEEMSKEELNSCLKYFYTSARKQDGSYFKATSLKSIRAAIDRHLRSPPHSKQFSIISDAAFSQANRVLSSFVKNLKTSGKIKGVVHREVITKEHLEKLFNSSQLGPANSQDPAQLQRTVWFYIGLYFGRRGLENQRHLKSAMLVLKKAPDGAEYFELDRQIASASTLLQSDGKDESDARVMFPVVGSSRCPVMTIKNYLSHLNSTSDLLFQRPKDKRRQNFNSRDMVWYLPGPVGRTTLDKLMTEMSRNAGIKENLTKQSLKATSQSILSGTSSLKEESVKAYESSQVEYLSECFKKQSFKSDLLANFVANEPPTSRHDPKFVGTIIEIQQRQPKDSAAGSPIVLEVRQIPITVQEESRKQIIVCSSGKNASEEHQLERVNVLPLPDILRYTTPQKQVMNKLIPIAPRPEKKCS